MKKFWCLVLACLVLAALVVGCGDKSDSTEATTQETAAQEATATPEPPYEAEVLTGEPKGEDYPEGERLTAVMVNNIVAARPQRGLSAADILFEIKVEGGITRFMALYSDYNDIEEVGPIRSARDQFFRLVLPWQPLYIHDGQSVVQAQYIADYDYDEWNVNNAANGYRDKDRVNWCNQTYSTGLAIEHTEYTNAENIKEYIEENNIDMNRTYNSTFFNFVDYRYKDVQPIENGEDAEFVNITHSQSYKTRFVYNSDTQKYEMQQYYYPDSSWRTTIDENNDQQLDFTNLIVLFTDIHTYPGHEAKDLQYAEYSWGGVGFYFYGGKCEKIYWQKGTPLECLQLYYMTDDNKCSDIPLEVNMGKSYVAVVDLDEYENGFFYSSLDGVDVSVSSDHPTIAASSNQQETDADAPEGYEATKGETAIDGDNVNVPEVSTTETTSQTETSTATETPVETETPSETETPVSDNGSSDGSSDSGSTDLPEAPAA